MCDDKRTAFHLNVSDLQAAQLLQGHAGILPQQTNPILQPADGGDGVARGLALQQRDAVHPERLIGRALTNDGRRPVCEHCKQQRIKHCCKTVETGSDFDPIWCWICCFLSLMKVVLINQRNSVYFRGDVWGIWLSGVHMGTLEIHRWRMRSPSCITGPTLIRRFRLMMSDLQGLITKFYLANLSTHYHTCVSTPIFS